MKQSGKGKKYYGEQQCFPKEIERKFLLNKIPSNLKSFPCSTIYQGYISIEEDGTELRLRKTEDKFYQTVKKGRGLIRKEIEIELTRKQFDVLWPLTRARRIKKKRYYIKEGKFLIELDIFYGSLKGLITAEIEFSDLKASKNFNPLPWFGREITQDDQYKNKNLALYGLPTKQNKVELQ